jgi:membrane-associated HD superfamily phosphohydrolase
MAINLISFLKIVGSEIGKKLTLEQEKEMNDFFNGIDISFLNNSISNYQHDLAKKNLEYIYKYVNDFEKIKVYNLHIFLSIINHIKYQDLEENNQLKKICKNFIKQIDKKLIKDISNILYKEIVP